MPRELVNLLHYVENSTDEYVGEVDDPNVSRIHGRVQELKRSREWEARYMQFQELLQEQRQEGRAEGRIEGRIEGIQLGTERILKLTMAMSEAGEADQISRLSSDPTFLKAMLAKYHLQDAGE